MNYILPLCYEALSTFQESSIAVTLFIMFIFYNFILVKKIAQILNLDCASSLPVAMKISVN